MVLPAVCSTAWQQYHAAPFANPAYRYSTLTICCRGPFESMTAFSWFSMVFPPQKKRLGCTSYGIKCSVPIHINKSGAPRSRRLFS